MTASVATINPDGHPQLTPNWCTHDGTYLYLNSVRDRLKDKNIRARPDVTVMLVNPENAYHWMTIYGTVEEIIEEDDPETGHIATEIVDNAIYTGAERGNVSTGTKKAVESVSPWRMVA